jgi:hypothetical protein
MRAHALVFGSFHRDLLSTGEILIFKNLDHDDFTVEIKTEMLTDISVGVSLEDAIKQASDFSGLDQGRVRRNLTRPIIPR